jgi:predicted alpha/beta-hydrolase family hydrolase
VIVARAVFFEMETDGVDCSADVAGYLSCGLSRIVQLEDLLHDLSDRGFVALVSRQAECYEGSRDTSL